MIQQRICRYRTCWRDIVIEAPSQVIESAGLVNPSMLCAVHERQLRDDLDWLIRNLPELEDYRLNRAYGHKTGGGDHGVAPAPLRESLADLLYGSDDHGYPGLDGVLYEWARTLDLPVDHGMSLAQKAAKIREAENLTSSTAAPVYAELLHSLTRRLRRYLTDDDGGTIRYGACPAAGCDGVMTARAGDDTASCSRCRTRMPVALLQAERVRRILLSDARMTRDDLLATAKQSGLELNRNTVKSWIRRGNLPQAGENEMSEPVYRVSDLYRLATGLTADADVWQIIETLTKEGNMK